MIHNKIEKIENNTNNKFNILYSNSHGKNENIINKSRIKGKRILFFDVLKTLAAFLTVLYHSSFKQHFSYKYYKKERKLLEYSINAMYVTVGRTSTSLFMMISGCIFLNTSQSSKPPSVQRRYFFKRLLVYLFWTLPYCLEFYKNYNWNKNMRKESIKKIIYTYVDGKGMLWYLKTLMFFHIITPSLQTALQRIKRKEYEILLLFFFFFYFFNNYIRFRWNFLVLKEKDNSMFFFYLLGPYLYKTAEYFEGHLKIEEEMKWVEDKSIITTHFCIKWTTKKGKIIISSLTFFLFFVSWLEMIIYRVFFEKESFLVIDIFLPMNVLLSSSIFLLVYSFTISWKPRCKISVLIESFSSSVGQNTMGIYMMNEFFLYRLLTKRILPMNKAKPMIYYYNTIYFSPFIATVTFLSTWCITKYFKKIPILKNLVS